MTAARYIDPTRDFLVLANMELRETVVRGDERYRTIIAAMARGGKYEGTADLSGETFDLWRVGTFNTELGSYEVHVAQAFCAKAQGSEAQGSKAQGLEAKRRDATGGSESGAEAAVRVRRFFRRLLTGKGEDAPAESATLSPEKAVPEKESTVTQRDNSDLGYGPPGENKRIGHELVAGSAPKLDKKKLSFTVVGRPQHIHGGIKARRGHVTPVGLPRRPTGDRKRDAHRAHYEFAQRQNERGVKYIGSGYVRISDKRIAKMRLWRATVAGRQIVIGQIVSWLKFDRPANASAPSATAPTSGAPVAAPLIPGSVPAPVPAPEPEDDGAAYQNEGLTDADIDQADVEAEVLGEERAARVLPNAALRLYAVNGDVAHPRGKPGTEVHNLGVRMVRSRGVFTGVVRLFHPERKTMETFNTWRVVRNPGTIKQRVMVYAQANV